MHIALPVEVREQPWWPHSRPFSEFEARLDYLIRKNTGETIDPNILASVWSIPISMTKELVAVFEQENFADNGWFVNDNISRKEAQQVIDLFNNIFDRDISLTDSRFTMIKGRFKEGRKLRKDFGLEQFKAVFEHMKKKWTGTNQEEHLVIDTLCRPSNFQKYLEDARRAYILEKKKKSTTDEGIRIQGIAYKPIQ